MQRSELTKHVKDRLRVSVGVYDSEVSALIDAAFRDLSRCGVDQSLLEGEIDPLVVEAVVLFCKALFGVDNQESEKFYGSYRLMVATIANDRVDYRPSDGD